jgi:peptidoglycan/LPS O-acetylase OafA/YrhL
MIAHRPEIDGLRAIAILPVVFFHAGFSFFQGGFVGVDVFFVISGYLITSILLRDLSLGQFSFGKFFERRARRILPALFFVMAVCVPFAHWLLLPQAFEEFAETAAAVALFLSNILFIDRLDYFAPAAELNPLLHTWSLAVEEQFYILFPPVLFLAWRIGGRRAAFWACVALLIGSFVLSEFAWRIKPAQTFFFFPTRAWELLAGVLCAFALSDDTWQRRLSGAGRGLRNGASLLGLGAILAAALLYDKSVLFPSYATLLPVMGVVAIILFAGPDTWVGQVLSWRGFVAIGLVSYSAYLWHQPLFAFVRIGHGAEPDMWVMLALCVLTFVLAAGSWWFVERPFRVGMRVQGPFLPRRGHVFAASGGGILAFLAFGIWGLQTEGRANLWMAQATEVERQTYQVLLRADEIERRSDNGACRFNAETLDAEVAERLLACRDMFGPGIAVLGDSHAIDLAEALFLSSDKPFLVGLTRGGCRPDDAEDECSYAEFGTLLARAPNLFSRVIFETAGQHMIEDRDGRSSERLFMRFGPEDAIDVQDLTVRAKSLAVTADYLQSLAQIVPVTWLTPRMEPHLPDSYIMRKGCDHAFDLRPGQRALFTRLSEEIAALGRALPDVTVLDQMAQVDMQMPDDFLTCAGSLWTDADHLSTLGRAVFGARLAPVLLD